MWRTVEFNWRGEEKGGLARFLRFLLNGARLFATVVKNPARQNVLVENKYVQKEKGKEGQQSL